MDRNLTKRFKLNKEAILNLTVFFAFISSLNPYFFWKLKAGIFYALTFFVIWMFKNGKLTIKNKFSNITILFLLYIAAIFHTDYTSIMSIVSHIFTILTCYALFSLNDGDKSKLFNYIVKYFSIILAISLCFHIYLCNGGELPNIGTFKHPDSILYEYKNYIFTLHGNYGVRFHSIFCEPGHVGMIIGFLLYFLDYNLKNKYVIILLISLLATLSLAGYALLVIGIFIKYIRYLNFKKLIMIISSLIILGSIYITVENNISKDSIVYKYVFKRLTIDENTGNIAGDNRVSTELTEYIYNDLEINELLLGLEKEKYKKIIGIYGGGSGYKMYILDYGIMSIITVFLFYLSLSLPDSKNRKFLLGALLLYSFAFIQRSYPFWTSELFIFILGISFLNQQKKCLCTQKKISYIQ